MRHHRVNDFWRFTKTPRYLPADDGVGSFDLLVNGFAHIMEQRSSLTYIYIGTQLMGDSCCQDRNFDRVGQHVLSVAGTEVEPTQDLEQLRLQAVNIGFKGGILASLANDRIHLLPRFGDNVFDAGRMDASVEDEPG